MKKAPGFSLPDQNDKTHTLDDYLGKWVVLYFYPKDDTPACTHEACSFRDERELIASLGKAEIIGVSMDSPRSHKKFAEKYGLNFPLLSDPEHAVIESYGAWAQKKLFGRSFMGIIRSTFIINPEGYIVKEYPKVNVKDHAAIIIRNLQQFQN